MLWFYKISCLHIHVAKDKTDLDIPYKDKDLVRCIYSKFNKSLYFSPTSFKMAYTVRDPVHTGMYRVSEPRGFAHRWVYIIHLLYLLIGIYYTLTIYTHRYILYTYYIYS